MFRVNSERKYYHLKIVIELNLGKYLEREKGEKVMSLSQLVKETWESSCKGAHRVGVADELGGIAGAGVVNLFTVTGGPIIVTNMWGMVTVVIAGAGGTGVLIILNHDPAGAAPSAAISAVVAATIAGDPAGTMYTWSGAVGGAITVAAQLGVASVGDTLFAGEFLVLVPGVVNVNNTGNDATMTGTIDWYMNYIPCHPKAFVEPA